VHQFFCRVAEEERLFFCPKTLPFLPETHFLTTRLHFLTHLDILSCGYRKLSSGEQRPCSVAHREHPSCFCRRDSCRPPLISRYATNSNLHHLIFYTPLSLTHASTFVSVPFGFLMFLPRSSRVSFRHSNHPCAWIQDFFESLGRR
jgi:hypothetical protein